MTRGFGRQFVFGILDEQNGYFRHTEPLQEIFFMETHSWCDLSFCLNQISAFVGALAPTSADLD